MKKKKVMLKCGQILTWVTIMLKSNAKVTSSDALFYTTPLMLYNIKWFVKKEGMVLIN
jgi:hypothetical protein